MKIVKLKKQMTRYRRAAFIIGAAIIFLASCAEGGNESIAMIEEREQVWIKGGTREETVLHRNSEETGFYSRIKVNGGQAVYSVHKVGDEEAEAAGDEAWTEGISDASEGEETYEELFYSIEEADGKPDSVLLFRIDMRVMNIIDYWPDGKGNIYYISVEAVEEEDTEDTEEDPVEKARNMENVKLQKYSQGAMEEICVLNRFYQGGEDECYSWKIAVNSDGRILVYSDFGYLILDGEGNKLEEENWKEKMRYDLVYGGQGVLMGIYEDYRYVFYWCNDQGKNREKLKTMPNAIHYHSAPVSQGDILVSTESALYSSSQGELRQLCVWADYGIFGDDIIAVYEREGRVHCILLTKGELRDITYRDGGGEPPVELTLGCFGENVWIRDAVSRYNRESNCIISIVDYCQGDDIDPVNKMYNDILAGRGPDIVGFESRNINDLVLSDSGMLEDLTGYLMKSETVQAGDIIEPLYERLCDGGGIYMLPTNFGLEAIVTKERWAGKDGNWTAEECLKQMKDNKKLEFGMSWRSLLEAVGAYDLYKGENGEELIREYMEMAEYLPDQDVFISDDALIHEGGVFCTPILLSDMETYVLKKSQWGEDVSFMGFPGAEGSGLAFLAVNCYGINSESTHKEEAWRFIESFFTEAWQENTTPNYLYFSVDKRVLERQFSRSMDTVYDQDGVEQPLYQYIMNGERIYVYPARQEDVDEVKKLLEGTRLMRRGNSAVTDIIREEALEYLQGGKQLEETQRIIHNRLAIYESEKGIR